MPLRSSSSSSFSSASPQVLLHEARLVVARGRRYGLMGRNGVGKTTLLRRIASGSVPGWPMHLTTAYVQQEAFAPRLPALECVLREGGSGGGGSGDGRAQLEEEQEALEALLADPEANTDDPEAAADAADRLGEVLEALETLDLGGAGAAAATPEARATAILRGLQFTDAMLAQSADSLSGGWRMRLALAAALFAAPDILLLDEPTNHLDLSASLYLEDYLVAKRCTALVVSHDAHFLDAVCTDVICFHEGKLRYHVGTYSSFAESESQTHSRNRATRDAVARKEKKAKEFIAKQRSMGSSKHRDDNKQKQAAERAKKFGRLGLYSENGQRFSLLSMGKTGGAGANRATHINGTFTSTNGQQSAFVSNEAVAFGDDRSLLHFKFPSAPPLKGTSGAGATPLITMDGCAFG